MGIYYYQVLLRMHKRKKNSTCTCIVRAKSGLVSCLMQYNKHKEGAFHFQTPSTVGWEYEEVQVSFFLNQLQGLWIEIG